MFKRGGSAGQGITSGLDRPGYAEKGFVDIDEVVRLKEKMKPLYGQPPQAYGVYDFLTDWGLRMASATPKGNVLQTAASEAVEPHERLMAGKGEAEMAEYMANIKAADQALGAVTDVTVARAENQKLKERTDERIIMEDALKIQNEANRLYPGRLQSIAQTDSGSYGIANGRVKMKNERAKGNYDTRIVSSDLYVMDDATKTWDFDEQQLSTDKIWFDIVTEGYLTVSLDAEGKKVAHTHTSAEEARKFLKTHKKAAPVSFDKDDTEKKKIPTEEKKNWFSRSVDTPTDFTYKAEDFMPKPDDDPYGIKTAEKDYDEMTKFWNWLSSPKGDVKKSLLAKKPEHLR